MKKENVHNNGLAEEQTLLGHQHLKASEVKEAAGQGDAKAQFNLGRMYYYGWGVEKNYEKAVEWYTKAAEQGDADAQYNLALMYYDGDGVKQDYEVAIAWFEKAAERGHEEAQFILGRMNYNGEGMEQDYEMAVEWFVDAADQGHAEAQFILGRMYYNGEGVEQNYKMAIYCWAAAAEQGHAKAQYDLGNCYYNGVGVKKNYEKAVECYTKAAENGNSDAEIQLALINKENQPARETPRPPVTTTVPDTYTVIYDGNGALDGQMKQEIHTCGEARKLQKNHFTRTGYKFLGWAKTPDGGRKYDDGEEVKDLGDKNSTVILYAHWKPIQ